jgi:hypothetical protein
MQHYVVQLIEDIREATLNLTLPYSDQSVDWHDWISSEGEDAFAPERILSEWTGITPEMLPPVNRLDAAAVHAILEALKQLLEACNCHFVLQLAVPEAIQYKTIRLNFDQSVKLRQWHMGFFDLCKPGTEHGACALGEYCHCAFFAELFSGMKDEVLSPEEERARAREIEINHIQRKYGDDWMKYYPYHLDKNFDDEEGNPYKYGMEADDDKDDDDNWWRK